MGVVIMKMTNVEKMMVVLMTCSACVMAENVTFTEETAAGYLKLTPPVKVLLYSGYMDGGSIGTSLEDATGKEFHIFEDWSIANRVIASTNFPESVREQYKDRPYTAGRIFIGKGSPTKDREITPVDEGKRIKAAVECLAIAWYDREVTTEEQTFLAEYAQQVRRKESPNYTVLKNKIVPPKKRAETEEESREFDDIHMKNIHRFTAALYIATKLKKNE